MAHHAGCVQPNAETHLPRPEREVAAFPESPTGRGRVERPVRPPAFAAEFRDCSSVTAARISSKERLLPATISRRDRSISSRKPGWVLRASDSLSTFRSGTIAATGRFRSVKTTTSSSSSAAYSASDRDAVESARVFISQIPPRRFEALFGPSCRLREHTPRRPVVRAPRDLKIPEAGSHRRHEADQRAVPMARSDSAARACGCEFRRRARESIFHESHRAAGTVLRPSELPCDRECTVRI